MSSSKVFIYLRDVLETVLSLIILSPVFLFIVVPVLVLSMALRLGVSIYCRLKYGADQVVPMPVVDASWAFETPTSNSICYGLFIIQGVCNPQRVRDSAARTIASKLMGGKLSRSIISVLGVPCWKRLDQGKMNMEKYVQVVLDDEERGELTTEEELFRYMSSTDCPFPDIGERAPWEMIIVPKIKYGNVKNENENSPHYAVIYKIHHGIMDGLSTINMVHSAIADKPFTFTVDPSTLPKPSLVASLWIYTLGLVSIPRSGVRTNFLKDRYFRGGSTPELTGPKHFTWSRPIRLDALKQIKTATNTAMFSILMSSLGSGLKLLYQKNDETNVPNEFHVLATVAMMPYPRDRKPCNRASGIVTPCRMPSSTDTPTSLLRDNQHLLFVKGRYDSPVLATANSFYPKITGLLPLFTHRPLGLPLHLRTTLTNLPGPKDDIFLYGGKVVDMALWVPIKYKVGLGVMAFSYGERVRISFVGDTAFYPHENDIQFLATAFEQELQTLGECVGVKDVFCTC